MEAMTPEERFTKIENLLAALTEIQVKHDAAIRDLIVVSRTTLDSLGQLQESQRQLQESQRQLQESQKTTEGKLHILIETVDRIIREK